ncbi:glycerol-3-phosphate dehydrogenase/oxidase [Pseudomonas sp. C27(2019)]|uniref:glycerol-3-phosphate dehydrogenase/oxidase n=1 Tax=Pseudomonas sp. C27(2019) TaxID=2604941 RepID=UPI002115245F|nr:glycerol-3-phosphate dehydrogenase/oxidase [Pseudomonas sp. C27(2019)]
MTSSMTQPANWTQAWREQVVPKLAQQTWDLIVIGGGITGAGVIREAAKRGWRCLLVEQNDFAWGTSSRSSKMVHGGLRYISQGELALTRDSVRERQLLLDNEAGLVDPLPFLYPHYRGEFPGRRVFSGVLRFYDFIAGQSLQQFHPPWQVPLVAGGLQHHNLNGASQFQDAVTDDARLVMHVLAEARALGACVVSHLRVLDRVYSDNADEAGKRRVSGVRIEDTLSGEQFELSCKALAQATGVWTDAAGLSQQQQHIRPLRGSHLLLPSWRLPVSQSVSFKHPVDGRLMFIFPWEGATVIGTTDIDHKDDLNQEAAISQAEVEYLLAGCAKVFPSAQIKESDVLSTWSGVRPIVVKNASGEHKPSDESREHVLWVEPGCVSLAGGKLTTFRMLALEMLQACTAFNGCSMQETVQAQSLSASRPTDDCLAGLSSSVQRRLYGRYRVTWSNFCAVFKEVGAQKISNTPMFWAELAYACEHELVVHLDDLLLRRTRFGLLLARGGLALLEQVRELCQPRLGWDDQRWAHEQQRYLTIYQQFYSLPSAAVVSL